MSFHLLLLWIHLIAAISWIGGMLFLSVVLAPLVRSRKAPEFMALFRLAARRFRLFVWSAIVLLLGTGPLLAVQRGWSLTDPYDWPLALKVKVSLVAALIILTLSHDLVFGPRMRRLGAVPAAQRSAWDQGLVRSSAWLPRLALVVALSVVAAALMLARS